MNDDYDTWYDTEQEKLRKVQFIFGIITIALIVGGIAFGIVLLKSIL